MIRCLVWGWAGLTLMAAEFVLTDHLGHDWQRELVSFSASPAAGDVLLDEEGRSIPFQRVGEEIAFLADLPALGTRTWRLGHEGRAAASLVKVEAQAGYFDITGEQIAVRIGRSLDVEPGTPFDQLPPPILQVKRNAGSWLGQGSLVGQHPVAACRTDLLASGPVFAEALVHYDFVEGGSYDVRIRVIGADNVVLVEEQFRSPHAPRLVNPPDLAPPLGEPSPLSDWLVNRGMGWADVVTGGRPCFRFDFMAGWEPTKVSSYGLRGETVHAAVGLQGKAPHLGLVLTPYQARGNRVTALAMTGEDDVLGIFSRYLSRWEHANENRVPLPWLETGLAGHFFAAEGSRWWGLWLGDPEDAGVDQPKKHGKGTFATLRQVQVRHGQTPLNKVKDWVLAWELPENLQFPRIYYPDGSVDRLRQVYARLSEADRGLLEKEPDAVALLTGDQTGLQQAFGRRQQLAACVNAFLVGGHDTPDTYTHRFQEVVRSNLARVDIGLADPTIAMADRQLVMARVAFLAYKIADRDYWRYDAYGGGPSNPNMMSLATNALAMCAAFCAGHPQQQAWLQVCHRLVAADSLMSIAPHGAWLESPGYQGAGNTPVNQTVLILRKEGIVDLTRVEPWGSRLMNVSTYYANLLTPPDPRFDGRRMPMALGDNVPYLATMYVLLAGAGRDTHPLASGHAVWAWQQMGRPVGHSALLLLQEGVIGGGLPAIPISGETTVFPGFGVMFRHGFGTDAETFMTLRQNDFGYGHYDHDQGSISLFAKGVPFALDWIDYSPGKAADHNRVDYQPDREPWLVPVPDNLTLHEEADYARMHQAGLPAEQASMAQQVQVASDWQRQVVLVKDTDHPGEATYIVFLDRVTSDGPNSWNLWLMAEQGTATIREAVVTMKGQYGVDSVITFFAKPEGDVLTTFHHHQTRSYIKMDQDQVRVQATAGGPADYGCVVYPVRRGTDVAPDVERLPSGAVSLSWPTGRQHLVFLFAEPAEVHAAGIHFRGRAAVVKRSAGRQTLIPLESEILEAVD